MIYKIKNFIVFLLLGFIIQSCSLMRSTGKEGDIARDTSTYNNLEYKYSLIEGAKQKYLGNFKSAAALYQNALSLNPSSGAAAYELANLYEAHNLHKQSIYYAKKAISIDPENTYYHQLLAEVYQKTDSLGKAVEVYKDMIKIPGDNHQYKTQLANLYIKQEKYKSALEIYDELEKEFGVAPEINLMKKELYVQLQDYSKALTEIRKLLDKDPGNADYLSVKADIYSEFDVQKAKKIYDSLLQNEPDEKIEMKGARFYLDNGYEESFITHYKAIIEDENIDIRDKMGLYIEITKNRTFLEEHYDEVREILETFTENNENMLRAHTVLSDFYIKGEDYENAAKSLKHVITFDNVNPVFYEQLINIYSMMDEVDSMMYYANKAKNIFPKEAVFYYYEGIGYIQKDSVEKAIDILNGGLQYSNSDYIKFQFYAYLGEAYYKTGSFKKSDEFYQKALGLDSMNTFILNNYSYYLSLREEKLNYALRLSKKTLVIDSLNATYLDTYAWILYKLGRFKEAKDYIERAIKYGAGKNPEVLEHYGDILFKYGNRDLAVQKWKKAYEFGGRNEMLLKKIQKKKLLE